MTKTDREKLETFKMWVWQKMVKISWVDAEVLESGGKQKYFRQYRSEHSDTF